MRYARPTRELLDDSDRSMVLLDFIDMIRRRKWYLFVSSLLSVLLGVVYLSQVEPVYKVEARILVQQQDSPLDHGRGQDRGQDFLATQAEIICSPAVVQRAVRVLALPEAGPEEADPASVILGTLRVRPVLGTNVLSISFRGQDGDEAVRTVESIITSYREYLRVSARDSHLEALRLLTEGEKEMRKELRSLGEQYRQLHEESPLLGQGKGAISVQRSLLTHLCQTLAETKTRRMELENQMRTLTRQGEIATTAGRGSTHLVSVDTLLLETPGDQGSAVLTPAGPAGSVVWCGAMNNAPDTAGLRRGFSEARVREKELLQRYGVRHPDVRAARQQIAAWESLLQESLDAMPVVLQQELAAVQLQEQRVDELYQQEFKKAKVIDDHLLKEQQMLDSIQRVQTSHQSTLTQLAEWQLTDGALADGRSGVAVSVLEAPALAGDQIWPPPALLLAACVVVGAIGGFGVISILERTDTKVRCSQEIQQLIDLPIIGRIPVIPAPGDGRASRLYRARLVAQSP